MYVSELSQSVTARQMFPPEFVIPERNEKKAKMEVDRKTGCSESRSPSCSSILKIYCRETSLHCLKYLVRPVQYERIFWMVLLVIVYLLGAIALWQQLLYFYYTPILITFQPKPTLVSSIPLPAFTLCPDMQVRNSAFNLSRRLAQMENFTKDEQDYLFLTTTMCDIVFDARNVTTDFSPEVIKEFSMAHNSYNRCKDFVVAAEYQWKRIQDPCLYFQPSFSPRGACVSFNLLPPDQLFRNYGRNNSFFNNPFNGREVVWNMEDGYTEGRKRSRPSPEGSPPWSISVSTLSTHYLFLLKVPTHLFDPICSGGKGFHGFLHNPAEIPSSSHTSFYVEPGHRLNLQIKPKIFTIEEQLKSWDPLSKMCFMQSERQLKFFKVYTRINCEIECESNFTQQKCGCATFFQPRDDNVLVCGPGVNECLSQYSEETDDLNCHCLPACSEIEYDADYVSQERNWPDYDFTTDETTNLKTSRNDTLYMSLKLSYRMKFILAVNRETASDFIDFVANVGGLLSLFTGFSILSLVEIFYFMSFKRRKMNKFQGQPNQMTNFYMKNVLF